jgi:hypothetical protein
MLRRGKITAGAAAIVVMAIAITAAYVRAARHRAPTADEFSVYAAFLSRLSKDDKLSPDRLALADMSLQLVAATGENWIPAELRPDPPDEAEASERFTHFCGALCGRDFMTKNLRPWRLKPASALRFPFDIVPTSAEPSPAEGGKWVVSVTRPGFDLWRHRAVFSYSFGCSAGATAAQDAVMCVQFGEVLLERTNGGWQVISYSAFLL